MSDKLYSRPRIKLPKFSNFGKVRKISGFKIALLLLFFSIIIILIVFLKFAYPIFKASCETVASSKGTKIINEQVTKIMQEYSYNDLITIEKDTEGKITFIEANSFYINEIVSKIVSNIQYEFDKIPTVNVFINMGSVSGITVLKNIGPRFNVELESAGTINSTVITKFESVGINQTSHKIYLDVNTNIGILTPFACFGDEINTEVLLTEAIIVGEVPETYYNLGDMNEEDTFNLIK